MIKRLKDYKITNRESRLSKPLLYIDFSNNEATRRMTMDCARRVISKHRDELQALAYK